MYRGTGGGIARGTGLQTEFSMPGPRPAATPAPAPRPRGPIDPEVIAALLKKYEVPAVSIAVIKDFKIDWAQGYGISDLETDARVGVETMFQAASISKPVAAMASIRAVQEGKSRLIKT